MKNVKNIVWNNQSFRVRVLVHANNYVLDMIRVRVWNLTNNFFLRQSNFFIKECLNREKL